jgi:hypothetical protein
MTLTAIRRVLQLEALVRDLEARARQLEAERDALRAALAERETSAVSSRPTGPENSPQQPH